MPDTLDRLPEMIDLSWVDVQVAAITVGDDEIAHIQEDCLHQTVLYMISKGRCSDPAACAKSVLKSLDLEFNRWCA